MTTALLLLLSGVLIGTGVSLIWRDVHKKNRNGFVLPGDPQAATEPDSDLEITVTYRAATVPLATAAPIEVRGSLDSLRSTLATAAPIEARGSLDSLRSTLAIAADEIRGGAKLPRPDAARPSATAQQWAALQSSIGTAVEQVNAVLAGAGVAIGAAGELSWGIDRAYGSHRRILVGGESVGWLRLEFTADGRFNAAVKSHKEDLAEINAESSTPASGLSTARASDLLSECLKPAASYAIRAGSGGDAERQASETAWKAVDPVVIAALAAANGALAQAGARLMPLTVPTWDAQLRRHRMAVAVEVFGNDVARMHIERIGEEMDVAVGLPDTQLANLGRRRRIALHGMTTRALAEVIADCAWPTISHFRETTPPA